MSAKYAIVAHKRDLPLLKLIQSYFGGQGHILTHDKEAVRYEVDTLKSIISVIVPHFDKYPLITKKRGDYILWKRVVEMMKGKQHLTQEGIEETINIRATINKGLSDELKTAFPKSIAVPRPEITQKITDPY